MKASAPLDDDIENPAARVSRVVSEDYVALAGSPVAKSQEALALQRSRSVVALAVCCIVATLLLAGAVVSYNLRSESGGGTGGCLLGGEKEGDWDDDANEFYKASRTGYHFQPEKNWMNGKLMQKGHFDVYPLQQCSAGH